MLKNAKKKNHEEEEYYNGVTFLSFQSGSSKEPSDRVLELISKFTIAMHKERIRTYTNMQIGKPGSCPPGGCQ